MELLPQELRIDVMRITGDGPCAVRVTHLPTGEVMMVDNQATTEDNQNRALKLLRASLAWDRTQPWTAPAYSLVLWKSGRRWRYAIHSEAGILDGALNDLDEEVTINEAQKTLLVMVQGSTGLTYIATWSMDKPDWWTADLTQVTLS